MNTECPGEWSRKFISDNLTKNFANTRLKQHRSDILYQEQVALLPATQLICENDDRKKKIRHEIMVLENERYKLFRSIDVMRGELYDVYSDARRAAESLRVQIRKMPKNNKEQKLKMKQELEILDANLPTIYTEYTKNVEKLEKDTIEEQLDEIDTKIIDLRTQIKSNVVKKRDFIKKCSDSECRGFLSTRWKCGMCHKSTCSDCHELKADDHTCNPDTLATAKLLSMDTKACPKCQTNIFKIDGCDQMWCTQCHTAFSWNTGAIEKKIHNPHYYQWKRLNGGVDREPGDVVCGNEMTQYLASSIRDGLTQFHPNAGNDDNLHAYISAVVRNCMHIIHVIIPDLVRKFRVNGNEGNITFADLTLYSRKEYLRKHVTQDQFKAELEKIDRNWSKATENNQVLDLLHNTVKDILFRFKQNVGDTRNDDLDISILKEISTIVTYANKCLNDVGRVYSSSSVYKFHDDLSFIKVKPE
jgi:ribosomal protein S27AE